MLLWPDPYQASPNVACWGLSPNAWNCSASTLDHTRHCSAHRWLLCRLSSLYMKGTCSSERNNEGTGCSNGISGSEVDSNSCEAVFADAPSNALHTPSIPGDRVVQLASP
jgi:hypothetical protein